LCACLLEPETSRVSKLQGHGHRNTRQGAAIEKAVADSDSPLTAEEVLVRAQKIEGGIGIATVHRHLKKLTEAAVLARVEIPGEPPRFEKADKGCHQHFKCEECGKVMDLDVKAEKKPTLPEGFKIRDHQTVIYGQCQYCSGR
jgi:Fur family ferric uptake transcriptional regulator